MERKREENLKEKKKEERVGRIKRKREIEKKRKVMKQNGWSKGDN